MKLIMEIWSTQYLLEHSDNNVVFEWLKKNVRSDPSFLDDSREELEKSLLDRNDAVINLGLALYGSAGETGKALFMKGDDSIKRAALSGTTIFYPILWKSWVVEFLPQMLLDWNADNLQALFSNSLIPDDLLVDLFERKEPFDSLDDKKWMLLCAYTISNDRLSTPHDDSCMDGGAAYDYGKVFTSAWWLFDKFPCTALAARVLMKLGEKLIPDCPHDMKVMEVIKKWEVDPDHEDAEPFDSVRSLLGSLLRGEDFDALKESDDPAMRRSYYRYLRHPQPDDIRQGFENEGDNYIFYASTNKYIFSNEDNRKALHEVCWEAGKKTSDLSMASYFNSRCDYWMGKHPEWFKDSYSDEPQFDKVENQDERVEKRIEFLGTQVSEIHRGLLGQDYDADRGFPPNINAKVNAMHEGLLGMDYEDDGKNTPNIISYLHSELVAISQLLVKIEHGNYAAWAWGIAGLALGYIFAQY